MATKKQIEANKMNGLKSTGPKDTSITKYNATKHALLSKSTPLDNHFLKEDQEEYNNLLQELINDHKPRDRGELSLVEEFCLVIWKKKRIEEMNNAEFTKQAKVISHRMNKQEDFDQFKLNQDIFNQTVGNLSKVIEKMKETKEPEEEIEKIEILIEAKENVLQSDILTNIKSKLVPDKFLDDSFQKYISFLDRKYFQLYDRLREVKTREKNFRNPILIRSENTYFQKQSQFEENES
jgi:hypothetical protein